MQKKRVGQNRTLQRTSISLRELVIGSLLAALIYAAKAVMSGLPNIEPVTLLIILYTLYFPKITPYILTVFILLEGLTFGFGIWWVAYLYIWPLLALVTHCLRSQKEWFVWASVAAVFGLLFGALCAIPWAVSGGLAVGITYWVGGIPFDIAHCAGNFVMMSLLFTPLSRCFARLR